MLDDYTKAEFPYEIPNWNGYGMVRLYGAFDNGRVVGASYWISENEDGSQTEYLSQVLDWDGQGIFSRGQFDSMNLPPPPAKAAGRVKEISAQIAELEDRLSANPDAPVEWRSVDEAKIKSLREELSRLQE